MALDPEKRKAIARGRKAGGTIKKPTTVSEALGPAVAPIVLGGREFVPGPFNFADAKRIEARFGGVEALMARVEEFNLEAIGYVIWLGLRKSDPELTEAELDELLPARTDQVAQIMIQVLDAGGLRSREDDPGNEPAPAAATA